MRAVAWIYLAAAYAFIYLPVGSLVLFSFQDGTLPVPPFRGPTLDWYAQALGDDDLRGALLNSILVATLSAAAACALAFLAAYGIARYRVPGAVAIRGLLIAPMTVSYLIVGLGLLLVFNQLALGRSLWAAGLGHVVINLPLCFAIVLSAMGAQQESAERAARDLGAGEAQVLALVTAPMVAPAILAALFLSFTLSWDEFIIAFLLTRFEVTLPVEIWTLLRSGLSPRTNAIGSVTFLVSALLVVAVELLIFARRR